MPIWCLGIDGQVEPRQVGRFVGMAVGALKGDQLDTVMVLTEEDSSTGLEKAGQRCLAKRPMPENGRGQVVSTYASADSS